MLLVPLCCVGTYSYLEFDVTHDTAQTVTAAGEAISVTDVASTPPGTFSPNVTFPDHIPEYTNQRFNWASLVCTVWYFGVLLMLLRVARDFKVTARYQNDSHVVSDGAVLNTLRTLEQRMGLRKRTRLLIHNTLPQPAALGILRPAILLPVSAITGLNTSQLEAILAHELAHIRRYDYLINIAQCIVEALFFFNPFVWLLSRIVRFERETCCDQLAAYTLNSTPNYARALLEAVEVFQAQPVSLVVSLGADKSTSFRERFRRLIRPSQGSSLRLQWRGLVGVGVATALLVTLFTFITHQTVFVAARLLTPEERVAKLTEIEESSRPEGQVPMTFSGRMYDEHGAPYTGYVLGGIRSSRVYKTVQFRVEDGDFNFAEKVSDGFTIGVLAEGYAPVRLGPYLAREDGLVDGIEIRLNKGITNTLRLVNENNEPLAGVKIWGGHQLEKDSYSYTINLVTDQEGECVVEGSTEFSLMLALKEAVAGYQAIAKELTLSDGGVHTWTLQEGKVITGTVISEMTGEPVANARIRLFSQHGNSGNLRHRSYSFSRGPVLATSDALGKFRIDTMVEETTNTLFVEADGYAREVLIDIHEDSPTLMVEMGAPITLSGIIDVPDHAMPDRIRLSSSVQTSENHYYQQSQYSDVVDGAFHFPNLYRGRWEFNRSEVILRTTLQLDESIDDFVLKGVQMQTIQLALTVPEGHPPPSGEIAISPYNVSEEKNHHIGTYTSRFQVIDGKATIQIPKGSAYFSLSSESGRSITSSQSRLTGLQGYYVFQDRIEPNSTGDYPAIISVPCRLAGSVIVTVVDESGAPYLSPFRAGIKSRAPNGKGPHYPYRGSTLR